MTSRVVPFARSGQSDPATPTRPGPRPRSRRDRSNCARSVARLGPELRAIRRDLLAFAVEHGHPADADAASALLAAKEARAPEPLSRLDDDIVTELLWVDIFAWCNQHGVPAPRAVAATLHTWIDALATTGALTADSDPVGSLHDSVNAAGGVIEQGSLPGLEPAPTAG